MEERAQIRHMSTTAQGLSYAHFLLTLLEEENLCDFLNSNFSKPQSFYRSINIVFIAQTTSIPAPYPRQAR